MSTNHRGSFALKTNHEDSTKQHVVLGWVDGGAGHRSLRQISKFRSDSFLRMLEPNFNTSINQSMSFYHTTAAGVDGKGLNVLRNCAAEVA
jgi:hypothetical protein